MQQCTIGRMKTSAILKGLIPLTMARLTNQIVVCGLLTNILPALLPLSNADMQRYFETLPACDLE